MTGNFSLKIDTCEVCKNGEVVTQYFYSADIPQHKRKVKKSFFKRVVARNCSCSQDVLTRESLSTPIGKGTNTPSLLDL